MQTEQKAVDLLAIPVSTREGRLDALRPEQEAASHTGTHYRGQGERGESRSGLSDFGMSVQNHLDRFQQLLSAKRLVERGPRM